jgi:GMP synthase (glutamine-hydrolysing)
LPKDPAGFDKIIVSGSKTSALEDAPWIEQLHEFIRRAIDLNKPFLGVCYGHQSLVRAISRSRDYVRLAASAEFGWTEIHLTEAQSPLLKNIPSSFYSFSAHFEEASALPAGLKKLAYSDACGIQACQLENSPVFGIQFHPEKNLDEGNKILSEKKKTKQPPVLLNSDQGKKLYDPKLGETLFRNFLQA